jgi:hypothetical protein
LTNVEYFEKLANLVPDSQHLNFFLKPHLHEQWRF